MNFLISLLPFCKTEVDKICLSPLSVRPFARPICFQTFPRNAFSNRHMICGHEI
jgi:hypothetical protein